MIADPSVLFVQVIGNAMSVCPFLPRRKDLIAECGGSNPIVKQDDAEEDNRNDDEGLDDNDSRSPLLPLPALPSSFLLLDR